MEDLISIIVPIYNVEKYLERCILSLLSQTYSKIEIILVDDGSPDACPELCDQWAQKDGRICVVHKKNGGLSDARNAGLEVATGTYVAFVDSDDFIHPQFVEILYQIMIQEKADVVSCAYRRVREDSLYEDYSVVCYHDISLKMIAEITPATIGVEAWNKLYRRDLFDQIRFPVRKIHEDVGIWWKMVYYADKIAAVSEELYFYCENPTSIMRKSYTMAHMDMVDVLYDQYDYFKKLEKNQYASRILKECMDAYPGLYVHLNEAESFGRKERKEYFNSYKTRLKIMLKESNIKEKDKIKHLIYKNFPFIMQFVYRQRYNKGE